MKPRPYVTHVLPEDRIVDPVAVEIVVTGSRPVALTPGEQRAAARVLITRGMSNWAIGRRLRLDTLTVAKLRQQIDAQEAAA